MTLDPILTVPSGSPAAESLAETPLIMLIEDDFILRSTLTELLRDQGYRIDCYANGVDALKRLHEGPAPDVILLDVMLPYMDGVQFREKQLASPASHIPVIVITAVGVPPERAAGLSFARTFWKPLDVAALLGAIRELCPPRPA
jgi:CheY-like chemotaxis protein